MTLRTRQPSGKVAFPLILLEGEEKAGKSVAALKLSSSPKVGRTFVFDLGEGTADEYAELGPYEIVETNGTYTDLLAQLEAACAIPADDGSPNVIVIDDMTALWDLLKAWTDQRARQSKTGQRKLAEDPDAEIDPATNLWNDSKDRWNRILNLLRRWPGIAVAIAKGKEVTKFANGQPVAGQTEWKVDAEKTTTFAVSAWVRMMRPHVATLVGVRSLHVDVPARGLRLPEENPLEHLIFDVLGAGAGFGRSTTVMPEIGTPVARAKTELIDVFTRAGHDDETAKREAKTIWAHADLGTEISEAEWTEVLQAAALRLGELRADAEAAKATAPEIDAPSPDEAELGREKLAAARAAAERAKAAKK